jgi:hypothetical protein
MDAAVIERTTARIRTHPMRTAGAGHVPAV